MKVRFGVSVISGTAFPHRRDLDKLAELIRIIDGSGIELIATNDTSFAGHECCKLGAPKRSALPPTPASTRRSKPFIDDDPDMQKQLV
jgi:hypothetical protein